LVKKQCHNKSEIDENKKIEIKALKEQVEKLKTKISNQAKQINSLKKKK